MRMLLSCLCCLLLSAASFAAEPPPAPSKAPANPVFKASLGLNTSPLRVRQRTDALIAERRQQHGAPVPPARAGGMVAARFDQAHPAQSAPQPQPEPEPTAD